MVFRTRIVTKKAVPRGARALWAQCLVQALAAAADTNSVAAWADLLCLPKVLLRSTTRGGRNRKRGEAETKSLCRKWLEGHRASMKGQAREVAERDKVGGAEPETLQEGLSPQRCGGCASSSERASYAKPAMRCFRARRLRLRRRFWRR